MPRKQTITLRGEAARGTTVSATVLRDLLNVLIEGSQKAVRLQVEGRSTARGTPPRWLEAAAAFDVEAIREGSTQLVTCAATLQEAVPELAIQLDLFRVKTENVTALELLEMGLRDALAGEADSDFYDAGLLDTVSKLGKVLAQGFDEVAFGDGRELVVTGHSLDVVKELGSRVPEPRYVRVVGKLEQIQHSDRRFNLIVDGRSIQGIADQAIAPEDLAALFGKQVAVAGKVSFRASGSVFHLDAETIEAATEADAVWQRMPRPLFEQVGPAPIYRVAQSPGKGLAAIIGRWPGDESDEEIAELLEKFS